MVDRNSSKSKNDVFKRAQSRLNQGLSICIFPEGGVPEEHIVLDEFKDGAFRIAIETQTPVIPFVMLNNKKLLPRRDPLKARPGLITTVLLPEVSVVGLSMDDVPLLKKKVYEMMEEAIM